MSRRNSWDRLNRTARVVSIGATFLLGYVLSGLVHAQDEFNPRLISLVDPSKRAPDGVEPSTRTHLAKWTAANARSYDVFGVSVSISGNTAVVGTPRTIIVNGISGSAYVFVLGDGSWNQVAELAAGDTGPTDDFGSAVSISGDTIVVGAPGDSVDRGSAFVYARISNQWARVAKLTPSDPQIHKRFGRSVSISGDTVVVGAGGDGVRPDSGTAYVYGRDVGGPGVWGQWAKLVASDGRTGDGFGLSASVSGDTIVVGSPFSDHFRPNDGSVYVFELNDVSGWQQSAKLEAFDWAQNHEYGISVSISAGTVVVGARRDQDMGYDSGAAYVYERGEDEGDPWGRVEKLTAADGEPFDGFGGSVAIAGDFLVVGSRGDDDAGPSAGAGYVFERNRGGGANWEPVAKWIAADGQGSDILGDSVSISGSTVLAGAPLKHEGTLGYGAKVNAGAVYVFDTLCAPCGDGILQQCEECDDGNLENGDLCDEFCQAEELLVVLESFTASSAKRGVMLGWATALELDTVGFRVLRGIAGLEKALELLTPQMIPAMGTNLVGAEYSFVDTTAPDGTLVYYLEDVDSFGRMTRHGPVTIDRRGERKPRGR